ncbi:hypothetical protein F511_13524 [Dorcoceras hygrometricum]|uniref:Phosphoglycerate mutase family protein n=1 Tax=Dorcoceras hygrometricum TaxID=472368 RepID=A0A2Z7BAJ7_9LAMI|nr:hypothetical protein F511_13524 [Dorcoceras hygrometricum]
MGSSETYLKLPQSHQNVVVLRHGDRVDYIDPLWTASAARPVGTRRWLMQGRPGLSARAGGSGSNSGSRYIGFLSLRFSAACRRRMERLWPSPPSMISPRDSMVSVEYGLCEMLNSRAIKPESAPKDGIFSFDISKCEAELPSGTVDTSVEPIYKELPKWGETAEGTRARYLDVIKALANKYPSDNLLLVTHGEGVASSVCGFVKDVHMIREVDYCAYSHLFRPIFFGENNSLASGDFIGSPEGQVGVTYFLLNNELDKPEQNSK